jgi:hypothetical protein
VKVSVAEEKAAAQARTERVRGLMHGAVKSRRVKLAALAIAVLTAAGVVGAIWIAQRDGRQTSDDGAALGQSLGLKPKNACGTRTVSFRPAPYAEREKVFDLQQTWYWVSKCLVDILDAATEAPSSAPIHAFLHAQVRHVMSRKPVRFYRFGEAERSRLKDVVDQDGRLDPSKFDRIVYANEHGIAHNAMSQMVLGIWLLEAKRRLAGLGIAGETTDEYETLGIAAIRVALDEVEDAGLRNSASCDLKPEYRCAWFHAITGFTKQSSLDGGTLNKHLIAVVNLDIAANKLIQIEAIEPNGMRPGTADEFRQASVSGIHQLVYAAGNRDPGSPPNLYDFIAKSASGSPIARSWLYYAINPQRAVGWFLRKNNFKNCEYHLVDMRLLRDMFGGPGRYADISGFIEVHPQLDRSLIEFILDVYRTKMAEGFFADSPTMKGGNFAGCREGPFNAPRVTRIVDDLTNIPALVNGAE